MAIFEDSTEESKNKNTVYVDNTNDSKVKSNEILAVLIVIAMLLLELIW